MAEAVQLQRVEEVSVLQQELVYQELVLLLARQEQVPHGVIEHHQHIRLIVQRRTAIK